VPLLNDGWSRGDEFFSVVLANPSVGLALGSPSSAQISVQDNDAGLSFDAAWLLRGGTRRAVTLKVRLASDTSLRDHRWTTRHERAAPWPGRTISAAPRPTGVRSGETEKTLIVPVLDDQKGEVLESFE